MCRVNVQISFSGEGLSLDYGQSGIGILICLHPTPILWSLHITNQRWCAHRSTFKLCGVAFEEGLLVPPQRENPLFCATLVGEIVPLYPPSDADFVFSDIRGGHSVPVSWVGFHWWDFLPSTFCHSVGEMAPHYSPKRDNNNRFLRVPSVCARFMGGVKNPGFPSRSHHPSSKPRLLFLPGGFDPCPDLLSFW